MNERIKELAKQAGFYVSANGAEILIPDPHTEDITVVMEKFAELIVRECASIVEAQKESLCDNENEWQDRDYGYEQAVIDSVDMIKQHFGVK